MYVPSSFKNENFEESCDLIRRYPLAIVISNSNSSDAPFVSHLPLILEESDAGFVLIGHLARANPHWKLLHEKPVTVIFNGPNTYITPKWYQENSVPTWNYAVVHIQGTCSLIQDSSGIQNCLKKLTAQAESTSVDPWRFWMPDDLSAPGVLEKAIVGITIQIEGVQSKFKLSQNRSEADRQGVMRGLEAVQTDASKEILKLMKTTITIP